MSKLWPAPDINIPVSSYAVETYRANSFAKQRFIAS